MNGIILASIPVLPASYLLIQLLLEHNPIQVIIAWLRLFVLRHLTVDSTSSGNDSLDLLAGHFTSSQLLAYVIVAIFGYLMTDYLIPAIKVSGELRVHVVFCYSFSSFSFILKFDSDFFIPLLQTYTLRKGISGKDLGKRGTELADKDV
jgi:hypothetical protein